MKAFLNNMVTQQASINEYVADREIELTRNLIAASDWEHTLQVKAQIKEVRRLLTLRDQIESLRKDKK